VIPGIAKQCTNLSGGSLELEQSDSADSPLGIYGLYAGRDRQPRRGDTEEVHRLGGALGGIPARVPVFDGSVLVCAAVCRQVAQRSKHQLN